MSIKQRVVTIKGPRGEITKDFRHIPVELSLIKLNTRKQKGQYLNLKMWFGSRKQACSVSTLKSLLRNMVTGVTLVSLKLHNASNFSAFLQAFDLHLNISK